LAVGWVPLALGPHLVVVLVFALEVGVGRVAVDLLVEVALQGAGKITDEHSNSFKTPISSTPSSQGFDLN